MSANLRFFQSMIRAERARVKRRPGRTPATPKPRADQQVQESEVGLGSAPEIVSQRGFPPIHTSISGVNVTVTNSNVIVDWPEPETQQAEKTSIGRRRPMGPGVIATTVDFWNRD